MKKIVNKMMAFLMVSMFVIMSTIVSYAYTPTNEVIVRTDTQKSGISPRALLTKTISLKSIDGIWIDVTYVVNDGTGVLVDIKSTKITVVPGGITMKSTTKYISPDRSYGTVTVKYSKGGKTYFDTVKFYP